MIYSPNYLSSETKIFSITDSESNESASLTWEINNYIGVSQEIAKSDSTGRL